MLELGAKGLSALAISEATGVPRSTVRNWLEGRVPHSHHSHHSRRVDREVAGTPERSAAYVYLLGLYLGDGCISTHPRGVYRMRICLDMRYPGIVEECRQALREVLPHNKVALLGRTSGFTGRPERTHVEVSAYSRSLPVLFPQHGPGRKHDRRIALESWQRRLVDQHPRALLRGLIHSDGCRFVNTGTNWRHPRYSFSNRSEDILGLFRVACDLVGVASTRAPHTVYVSRKDDVAELDRFIGPKG